MFADTPATKQPQQLVQALRHNDLVQQMGNLSTLSRDGIDAMMFTCASIPMRRSQSICQLQLSKRHRLTGAGCACGVWLQLWHCLGTQKAPASWKPWQKCATRCDTVDKHHLGHHCCDCLLVFGAVTG
jgi:hypothetical protein